MTIRSYATILLLFAFSQYLNAQTKILFDATKAETAGNADWVIDADLHNIGYSGGPAVVGTGNESNPQQLPTPAQSTITQSTVQSYWQGGISAWGIDLVKKGYWVESLSYNGQITYGNAGNTQDLSNYKVFIVCEPNILFTAAEKTALMQFVQNGGGLFMVSDHDVSDRNNDGADSPLIWNDFMTNNGVASNPFGMSFDYANFSQTTTNIPILPNDPLLHGVMGDATQAMWSAGTSITLSPSSNSSVLGVVYKTGSAFGNTGAMVAYSTYGSGKVVGIGDSSPCDDGSGDAGDVLYDGWVADAGGNHRTLIMNATIWLATSGLVAPSVTTSIPASITTTTATSGGNVTADGGATVTARGVCWSANINPVATGNHTNDGTGTGTFTSSITGLTAGTVYHVRAYATNSVGTTYGSNLEFTTTVLPNLSVNLSNLPVILTGFTYATGAGPSVSQNYSLGGTALSPASGNISITGTSGFEVSSNNSTFGSSVSLPYSSSALPNTIIYVRMKSGLAAGIYSNELVANTGGGAATVYVSCSGSVINSFLPEPTNYPSSFSSHNIQLQWIDAAGTSAPSGYLIRMSSAGFNSIAIPVDGNPVADNVNDLNVLFGVQNALFSNLVPGTTYYFKLFGYTGSGTGINYKTDGSVPQLQQSTGQ